MRSTTPTTVAVLSWPVVGGLGWVVAGLLPDDVIGCVAVSAVLWSLPPWMGLLWPVWTALVALLRGPARRWMWVSLLGLIGAGVPVQCVPAARPIAEPAGSVRVAVWNVNAYSPDRSGAALFEKLGALSPDVVVILERRFEDIPGFERVADDFAGAWPRPSHHSAVYRRPGVLAEAAVTPQLGSETMAMPVAIVWLPGPGVCLLAVHAPPQVPIDPTGMAPYVQWLVDRVEAGRVSGDLSPCEQGAPVVMTGDFNHVPGSGPLRRFARAGLEDPLSGTGLFGLTWPSGGGWPDLPVFRLDHVLVGPLTISELQKTRVPGWVFSVSD